MHYLLGFLHKYIPSYGVCIILLTVIVRLGMFPISRRQSIASRKMQARMQKLSPEMKKIREKYKNDFAATSAAQQELYRRHGINPFGQLGGCLLIFLQMPIFLGLYYCLQESIHFRLEQFLTPWWIRNLAAPDMLIWWSEKIPWISTPDSHGSFLYLGPYFNILPVIAVALMLVQQKLTMPPPADEQAEFSMKMMKWMMVVMGVMFYKMPAGLCLYFIATSLWGLAERKLLPKTAPATEPPAGGDGKQKASPIKSGPDGASPKSNGFFRKMRDRWDELLRQAAKDPQARKKKK